MAAHLKESLKNPNLKPPIAAAIIIAVTCLVFIGWFYGYLGDKLFAERQAFFTLFAEKTAENIDQAVDDWWQRNLVCHDMLELACPADEDELLATLARCAEAATSNRAVVLAFDETGSFWSSGGQVGWFGHDGSITFGADAPERQTTIANLPYESNESVYVLLFARMDERLALSDGTEIAFLALAVNVALLEEDFAAHGFGENCRTYLVTDEGRKLYRSDGPCDFVDGYNILSTLEREAEVIGGGTMDDLMASFKSSDITAFEIECEGEEWFVSFQTIASGSHRLAVFAPSDLIGDNAAELTRTSFWSLALICVLLALLFVIFVMTAVNMFKDLQTANKKLGQDAEAADAANRAKSDFLSRMSHDIRTPINGIMGMTAIALRSEGDPARVEDCLAKIDEASRHLLSLVNDALDMSRIEQGRTDIAHEPVNLPALLGRCRSIIEGEIGGRSIQFVCDFDEMPHPHVVSDALHLRQILVNILDNAVKFTPDDGRVTFRARQEDAGEGRVLLSFEVEDTGIGMEQSYLEHIWEPFSQSKKSPQFAYDGTGLGLSIVKRLVDMMGGDISIKTELGSGSTFFVSLEVDVDPEPATDEVAEAVSDFAGMHALVVEDIELNREIVCEFLGDLGVSVEIAENGAEALEKFLAAPPGTFDVVFMDVMMPVMDGLEATRAIRASAHPDAADVAIVALTAHAYEEDARRVRDAGMNCHVTKPFGVGDLEAALKNVTASPVRCHTAEGPRPT